MPLHACVVRQSHEPARFLNNVFVWRACDSQVQRASATWPTNAHRLTCWEVSSIMTMKGMARYLARTCVAADHEPLQRPQHMLLAALEPSFPLPHVLQVSPMTHDFTAHLCSSATAGCIYTLNMFFGFQFGCIITHDYKKYEVRTCASADCLWLRVLHVLDVCLINLHLLLPQLQHNATSTSYLSCGTLLCYVVLLSCFVLWDTAACSILGCFFNCTFICSYRSGMD